MESKDAKVIKIKANGQKIKIRILDSDEIITDNVGYIYDPCGYTYNAINTNCLVDLGSNLHKSYCVGEKVSDHPSRLYFEILSKFYVLS